ASMWTPWGAFGAHRGAKRHANMRASKWCFGWSDAGVADSRRSRKWPGYYVRKYVHQGRAEGRVEGRVEGEVAALFAVLSARGIDVPDDARARISACTDPDQLEAWIRRRSEERRVGKECRTG